MRIPERKNSKKRISPQAVQPVGTFRPDREGTLLETLFVLLPEKSRSSVKSMLAHRQVAVNRIPTTRFDYEVKPGDLIEINFKKGFPELKHPDLKILYEDDYLLVVYKRNGLLSVGTDREREKTAYRLLRDYLKEADPRNRIFILHRLDKDTSGVMMFAKDPGIQENMQREWNRIILDRKYIAVVEGAFEEPEGEIVSYLNENSAYNVYSSDGTAGKYAATRYRVLRTNGKYSMVELTLETGRKNQIRVHMQESGHPVVGDKKYGASGNPIGRLALHAASLRFIHPVSGEPLSFEWPVPARFKELLKQGKPGR